MGPIRNPNWSTSGMRVTLSYLLTSQVDAALVYSALVHEALRKSGLISNGCSGREIYLVYTIINNYANIFL